MLYQTLNVQLHPPYPIYIGRALLSDPSWLLPHLADRPVAIVTSPGVGQHHAASLLSCLAAQHPLLCHVPDGEPNKTLATWQQLLDSLAQHQFPRDGTLITLGGGTVGDVGGFAAACYQRGVAWLQIPTTLLAQVDASIGGKVGVNLPAGKNLVGNFYQPQAVAIDIDTLATCSPRDYHAGLAEVVKAALIKDADFFDWLETHADALVARDPKALLPMVQRACQIKISLVEQDSHEHGVRALLNLGHTFGHALEHCTQYRAYRHGEAVAVGLVLAAQLSVQLGWLSPGTLPRLIQLLKRLQLPTALPANIPSEALLASMRLDKKVRRQRLRFILLRAMGDAFIADQVSDAEVLRCLAAR